MTEHQNRNTMISLITGIAALVMTIVINFFLSPYIVRTLGEEANGFTQLASNFVNFASLLTVALNSMAGRFISISYEKKDLNACQTFYTSVMIGNLLLIGLLLAPAILCIAKLDVILNVETVNVSHVKLLFGLVFINFFIAQIGSFFTISVFVKNSQYIHNMVNMCKILLNALALIFMFSVFEPKIYYVSLISVVLSLLALPLFLYLKHRVLPEIRFSPKSFDIRAVWTLMSSGLWNTLNQCGNLLMTSFDLFLANLLIGAGPMGVLSIAKTIPTCIVQLGGTITASFSPQLVITYSQGKIKEVCESLHYTMTCSSTLISISIMTMCIYGESFYQLWVPSMDASYLSILSVLTCMAFIPFAGPQALYNVYTASNRLQLNSISVLVGGALNIAIVLLLLKTTALGLLAVAGVSSVISIVRNLTITVPYTAKLLHLKWYVFYKDVGISCLCCVVGACSCYLFRYLIPPTTWVTMLASVVPSSILSALLIFTLFLNKKEKQQLLTQLRRRTRNGSN